MSHRQWLFHKTEAPQIFEAEAVGMAMKSGWVDKPFPEAEPVSEVKEMNLVAMTVTELKEILTEKGVSEKDLKGLKKDDLIVMIGNL